MKKKPRVFYQFHCQKCGRLFFFSWEKGKCGDWWCQRVVKDTLFHFSVKEDAKAYLCRCLKCHSYFEEKTQKIINGETRCPGCGGRGIEILAVKVRKKKKHQ